MEWNKGKCWLLIAIFLLLFTYGCNQNTKQVIDPTGFSDKVQLEHSFSNAFLTYVDGELYFNYWKNSRTKVSENISELSKPTIVDEFPKELETNNEPKYELRNNSDYDPNYNYYDLWKTDGENEESIACEISDYSKSDDKIYTMYTQHNSDDTYLATIKIYDKSNLELISSVPIVSECRFESISVVNDYIIFTVNFRCGIYVYDMTDNSFRNVMPDVDGEHRAASYDTFCCTNEELYFCYRIVEFDGPDINTIKKCGLWKYDFSQKSSEKISGKMFERIQIFDDASIWAIDDHKLYRINALDYSIERIR